MTIRHEIFIHSVFVLSKMFMWNLNEKCDNIGLHSHYRCDNIGDLLRIKLVARMRRGH